MRGLLERSSQVQIFFAVSFCVVLLRAAWLHLTPIPHEKLKRLAAQQYLAQVTIPPYRGQILDRRGLPLALSVRSRSVAVNPRIFRPTPVELKKLSRLLEISPVELKKVAQRQSYFHWLKRGADVGLAAQVESLGVRGVHFVSEPSRYYPLGKAGSQLIGFVGIDQKGLVGLEYHLEKRLAGKPSKLVQLRDAKGRQILMRPSSAEPEASGDSVVLTIDQVLQKIAYQALVEGVERARAKRGFAITLDPHTGQILAVVGTPSFDPQDPSSITPFNQNNFAAQHRFEPGSTVKPIVVAAAMEKNFVKLGQKFKCGEGGRLLIKAPRLYIHDEHPSSFLTTTDLLVKSSNICTFEVAKLLGSRGLFESFLRYGIAGPQLEVEGAGLVSGQLQNWRLWQPIQFATISFGQGLLVTGLELVTAYSVFANGGRRIKPYLLSRVESAGGRLLQLNHPELGERVLSVENARRMRGILAQVVERGTGAQARSLRYTSGGKTGTAEIFDLQAGSYSKERRSASFIGMGPVSEPHLVVMVLIDTPTVKPYYGGRWAAPVFKRILEESLDYLHVKPDREVS